MRRVLALAIVVLACVGCASYDAKRQDEMNRSIAAAAAIPREPHLSAVRYDHHVGPMQALVESSASVRPVARAQHFACQDGATLALEIAADGQSARAEWSGSPVVTLRRADGGSGATFEGAGGILEQAGLRATWRTRQVATVVRGDTLFRISERFYGSGARAYDIAAANPDIISDPNRIEIGQVLRLPDLTAERRCRRTA